MRNFGFQRRRMYDALGVFTAIGCCRRVSGDTIVWHGMSCVAPTLLRLQQSVHADFPDVSLNEIVGRQNDVSISALTTAFILCFLGLQKRTLDIKHISRYLSRQSGRSKSTLCKIYQIAHILEAAGVVERSDVPREITIAHQYFAVISLTLGCVKPQNLYAISSILVQAPLTREEILSKRAVDFLAEVEKEVGSVEEETE
jgi:hypothetical protein